MKRPAVVLIAVALVTAGVVGAQVPPANNVPNWSVPAAWSPSAHGGGIQTMTDVTAPRPFIGITPCRIADTRTGQGFSGQAGPPIIPANTTRDFQISGSPGTLPAPPNGCAAGTIPTGAEAVSFQFTVVSPTADGNLIAWPAGSAQPSVSVLNWPGGTVALGNGTIVPLSAGGALSVRLNMAVGQSAHLVLDVNGYFSDLLQTPGNSFEVTSNAAGAGAVKGTNLHAGGYGVWGQNNTGIGVYGRSDSYNGVWAQSTNQDGLAAFGGRDGGYLQGARHGMIGASTATTVAVHGVVGSSASTANDAAGVIGFNGSPAVVGRTGWTSVGVRGENSIGAGVFGLSQAVGVAGAVTASGVPGYVAQGQLGRNVAGAAYGVFSFGDYGGTGAKHFVEPHPEKADMVIRYVALEGNESGTYFRGRGRFQNGLATIEVPEDFRLVTDRENLSVQVTPIGEMASVAVRSIGLDRIIVRGSRDVEFFYTVNGVRKSHKHLTPIGPGKEYMPETPDARMPMYLTEGQKAMLVSNGTYNPDGTVNMETGRRLGWDKEWEKRGRPAPQPTE